MTLVERFIEFDRWPTARKTALLMAVSLAGHIPTSMWGYYLSTRMPGAVRADGLTNLNLVGVAIVVVCLAAALLAMRRGLEARWTAHMVVVLYGSWVGAVVLCMGMWTSAFLAWAPLAVILVVVWYDERIGWLAAAWLMLLSAVVVALVLTKTVPFAPLVTARSIDAQATASFAALAIPPLFTFFVIVFLLSMLSVATRRLQSQKLRAAQALIRRYVPAQVADEVLAGHEQRIDRHERRKLTIFFSDLVGFTEIAEELEPEDLSRVLNEYFAEMTTIAQKHGGTVDELSGDAILIFFGAPSVTNDKDHALRAVRMAAEMQQAMTGLNARWRNAGITEALQVRMGLNTGVVTIGNFGSPDRMKYAVLGKHVNLAARLQAHCEPGRVLLSHATWLLVNDQIPCTSKGELQLKGLHKPVMTYELGAA